ncbi:type I inositol polyphosphate 5-phosphatase 10 isoform X2 [Sorghum bicolor]|uniref:type I inositol polyphosphate 5-phosphatase 10 isoform X2 n=1 Tax=Sorghum bicolor TaxID=4558 RepID=UPI000B424BE2|nr:type I inositol polyphosphate 5-phosphatase 10 isoform X2 [Sorghum bicolor]|eukprot:XP_021312767.1 type I inositol polyphosphate 5-phosphatase 10 isoform X2 [Sorghum bicolor]
MASTGKDKTKGCGPKLFTTKEKKTAKSSNNPSRHAAKLAPSSSKASSSSPLRTLSVKSMRLSHFLAQSSNNTTTEPIRIFVSTWNVGGKTPTAALNMDDFLPPDDNSDIYVLGFQEIVPLNAGNVLVVEDNEPAARWLVLINQSLNRPADIDANVFQHEPSPSVDSSSSRASSSLDTSFSDLSKTASGTTIFQKSLLKAISKSFMPVRRKQLKACNCPIEMTKASYRDACFGCKKAYAVETDSSGEDEEEKGKDKEKSRDSDGFVVDGITSGLATRDQLKYNLIACKQMVGIFVTVWVKKELVQHIGHLRKSCIGRGILGCLGNKGCISISMTLHQTSFCFVCSHLASGQKEGDEFRRNLDVLEILRLTMFSRICRRAGRKIPEKILDHDKVIWLGDLNYRIALSYADTKKLLMENDWDALFEKDQLKIERDAGRVFKGWNEGKIYFAPTYKYSFNSDSYAGETATSKKKRRTPAWCDRILWRGDGIVQLSYYRGESRFSDHRPVCGTFAVEVEVLNKATKRRSSNADLRIDAEELLPTGKGKGIARNVSSLRT